MILLIDILFRFTIDFILPHYIYYNWFQCLKSIRSFLNTIQNHQQWLINMQGFQLIRPISPLFDSQLYQLRRRIFEELRKHFLLSRRIARQYSIHHEQFICYIDLNEFGSLIQTDNIELDKITNKFDRTSINSLLKLCHLQINECIQFIHLNRPKKFWLFYNYRKILLKSIENLNQTRQNCSVMIDCIDCEKTSSNKLISSYFLLRCNCEQLFEMNKSNSLNNEQLKRIIQDLKTVIYSLEAIRIKPLTTVDLSKNEQIASNENDSSRISSYHRFDDQIQESMDEILICDTGKLDNVENEMKNSFLNIDDYDKRLLREQTDCLMKELQIAIQGKKQEWNEREQRLLGNLEHQENIQEDKQRLTDDQPFEKLSSIPNTISMLNELKHTFVLNKKKLNIDEDIFGENDEESFDDNADY